MPDRRNQPSAAERARRAADSARRGKQSQATKPTGRGGEDERTRSALHVSGYHSRRQTSG